MSRHRNAEKALSPQQAKFLEAYERLGCKKQACAELGIPQTRGCNILRAIEAKQKFAETHKHKLAIAQILQEKWDKSRKPIEVELTQDQKEYINLWHNARSIERIAWTLGIPHNAAKEYLASIQPEESLAKVNSARQKAKKA